MEFNFFLESHYPPSGKMTESLTFVILSKNLFSSFTCHFRARSGASYPLEVGVRLPHPAILLQCDDVGGEPCRPLAQLEPCPPSGSNHCEWLPVHTFSVSIAIGTDFSGYVEVIEVT